MTRNDSPTRLDWFWALGVVVAAILVRLFPHWWNVTPMGALALFVGCRFRWNVGYFFPLAAMLISDLLLWKFRGFAPFDAYVYFAYALYILGGALFVRVDSPLRIGGMALAGAAMFFLITNFGSWRNPLMGYPQTWDGLMYSYTMGLAFIEKQPLGIWGHLACELFFCAMVFGGYSLVHSLRSRSLRSEGVGR